MNPRFPVYVPTKGRYQSRYTIKTLEALRIPYRAVVEPQEYDFYAAVVPKENLLVTPHQNRGLVVTRNWIWDHALASGTPRYWTMDDNISGLYRLNRNLKTPVADGTIMYVIEDFVLRYQNVPIAGMNYFMFASRKSVVPPFTLNTRVYSNMLIETDARDPRGKPYRNEGFYNDDTDLCLRVLKDGNCTILFNAFLIGKHQTMCVKGGMTPHYQGDGRRKMAEELAAKHPDVTTITRKWGRWQHQVDYSAFERTRLVRRRDLRVKEGVDNFGMRLIEAPPDVAADPVRLRAYWSRLEFAALPPDEDEIKTDKGAPLCDPDTGLLWENVDPKPLTDADVAEDAP